MKPMGILRLESFKSGSMREVHRAYKKMWWGALCLIIFGGEVGTCLRSLNENRSNISTHEADQAAAHEANQTTATMSVEHHSSRLLSRTSKKSKLERFAMQFQSKFELRCERQDLTIITTPTQYLPNGMPIYGVQITNTCLDCCLTNILVACGQWASGTLVNPHLFRRVTDDDCLVNDGNALDAQEIFFFEYSNSFPYPLSSRSFTPVCA